MSDFSTEFIRSIEQHCVGKTIVRVEADGTFEDQKAHWVHLDDGTRLTFVTGSSGLDSDVLYGLEILDSEGTELISTRRYPSSGYDAVHSEFVVSEQSTPPLRSGFNHACGQTITAAYFGENGIGVCLNDRDYLVSNTAGYILYATWLYQKTADEEYAAIAKTITGEWKHGSGFGLTISDQDKLC